MSREFRYDNAGNLLEDGRAGYEYDAFNRCTKVETFDGNIQISRYDAEGLRHEMEENGKLVQFIFRGDKVVAEENQEDKIRYIRTGELLASGAEYVRTYYHYASDEMGSITHVVTGQGKESAAGQGAEPAEGGEVPESSVRVLNRYEYDAWGNLTVCEETVPNRFKFNSQQYDPVSQQYYLRARYYNPVIGRFTQEDTYRGDGLNLYAYCKNNPVYYVDPSGHKVIRCAEAQERMRQAIAANQDINGMEPSRARELKAWYNEKKDHNRLTLEEKELARQIGLGVDGDDATTTICWGIHNIEARPEGGGYWGERIPQSDPRVDAFELKINPQNESFYLPMPSEGYVQFENMVNNVLQDGKLVMSDRSIYHVADLPGFAREDVLNTAQRQLEAANAANYRVEWLVSDQKAVDQLTALFREQNVDIAITYFPE